MYARFSSTLFLRLEHFFLLKKMFTYDTVPFGVALPDLLLMDCHTMQYYFKTYFYIHRVTYSTEIICNKHIQFT